MSGGLHSHPDGLSTRLPVGCSQLPRRFSPADFADDERTIGLQHILSLQDQSTAHPAGSCCRLLAQDMLGGAIMQLYIVRNSCDHLPSWGAPQPPALHA